MYDKREITVFPYDSNALGLLLCKEFLDGYDVINLCTMRGWKNDVEMQEYKKYLYDKVEINYGDSLEAYFNNSDTMLFIDSDHDISTGYYIYPQMYKAAIEGKNIIDICDLSVNMF